MEKNNIVNISIGDKFNPHGLFNGIHIPDAMCSTKIISWSAKACWGKLKEWSGVKGFCYHKQEQLVTSLGLSLSTVQRALKELLDEKFIEIEKPQGHQKLMHFNHKYFFLFHECLSEGLNLKISQNDLSEDSQNDLSEDSQNDLSNIKGKSLKDKSLKDLSSKEERSETDVSLSFSSKLHKRSKGQMLMSAKLSVKPLKEKKPVKPYEASSKAEHLMKYWKGKDLHVPRSDSESYRNSLISFDKLLSGKVFNGTEFENYENAKIDIKDIRKAIDRFALMSLNPDYEPRDINYKKQLSKFTPANFIFNSYQKTTNGYGRSRFIYCLENEAKLIREKDVFVEDKYPITSNAVAKQFKEKVLGGVEVKFTNDDINCFRKAANFATNLFKDNKKRLLGTYANMEPFRIANCLFETLEYSNADFKQVRPHWLCNNIMQQKLIQYLNQSGIFQDIDCSAKEKAIQYHNFGEPFRG